MRSPDVPDRAGTIRLSRGWSLCAIAALIVIASAHTVNLADPFAMDFISYWAAGKLTLAGNPVDAWDIARHHAVQARAVVEATTMPFPYPPYFLFVVAPFALLPFAPAAFAWTAATLAAYVAAVWRLVPGSRDLALAFPPVIACGVIGQNGLLTASIAMAAVALLPTRRFAAGVLIACLAFKPQLGLIVPLAFLAGREWRAFGGATAGVAILGVASLAAFGWPAWRGFVDILPLYARIASENLVGWQKMASVYAAARSIGMPDGPALMLHAAVAAAGAALVWQVWRRTAMPLPRAAALATASLLVSPYVYLYDQPMLVVPLGYLATRGMPMRAVAALSLIPLVSFVQIAADVHGASIASLLPLALLALQWRGVHRAAQATAAVA